MLVGLVGKPSSGKSTFFKAATLIPIETGNRPFVTIKPNRGFGHVRIECVCKEFNKQCNPRSGWCKNGYRFVPLELIDVAGLVIGSHKGEGLGLQFMNDLNQADVLIHIIDISGSTNEKGESIEALSYDPLKDVEFLEKELDFWYLDIVKRGWGRFSRSVKMEGKEPYKEIAKQLSGLGVDEYMVKDVLKKLGLDQNKLDKWSEDELLKIARELRILSKPMIIAANKIDIDGAEENLKKMKEKYPEYHIIPCSADYEVALRILSKNDVIEYQPGDSGFEIKNEVNLNNQQKEALNKIKNFLDKFGSTGVQDVLNKAVFDILKYKAVFPGGVTKLEDKDGNILPDCFLLKENSTALDFAYKLHQDIGEGFVKAIDVKTKRVLGKDYILKHRDVIEIKTA